MSVYTGDFHDCETEGIVKLELVGKDKNGTEVSTGMQELTKSKNHYPQKFKNDRRDEFDFKNVKDIGELMKVR